HANNGTLQDYILSRENDLSLTIANDIAYGLKHIPMCVFESRGYKRSNSELTLASDIYDLGVIMWSISSRKYPFKGSTDQKTLVIKDRNSELTSASDIYDLGVIMWSISSRKFPFEGSTGQKTLVDQIILKNIREQSDNNISPAYTICIKDA
ncbi:28682_t:CDS:2, partial [Racocetra persica]